jgi:hypothetical protein
MRKVLVSLLVVSLLSVLGGTAMAANFDFMGFAKGTFLNCAHPTTDVAKAKFEFDKEPAQDAADPQITKARVKIFYEGWVKKNSMTVDIFYLETPSLKLVHCEVLEESSGTGEGSCKYTSGWHPAN